jgi:ATP-binding cassette subfamily F protein 3
LDRGSRIGVLGRNGAGKSTVIRTVVGDLKVLAGEVHRAANVRIGYFAQQQVEALCPEDSALAHLQRLAPQEREQHLRNWLARFAFQRDDATRPVGPMSGGERARLALALLVWGRPQLLILDEPTNHLDDRSRDALADALTEFEGAVLLVSNDRYLLRATVERFIRVADCEVTEFDGDLEDYAQWLIQNTRSESASGTLVDSSLASRRDERRVEAEKRAAKAQQRKPLHKALTETKKVLQLKETRILTIDSLLADPNSYRKPEEAAELSKERTCLAKEQQALKDQWVKLSEALEHLDADGKAPARRT